MKKIVLNFLLLLFASTVFVPLDALAGQRRRAVVRRPVVVRRPIVRRPLVVHRTHPIRRVLPTTVVVRPARKSVVVGAPLVYLPPVVWTPASAVLPNRNQLAWQDTETIEKDEGWVDSNFGVDESGNALFLDIGGRSSLSFAEVTFANGNVQVVDFNDQPRGPGLFRFLDFANLRHVKTVRILARSETDETKLAVYLSK